MPRRPTKLSAAKDVQSTTLPYVYTYQAFTRFLTARFINSAASGLMSWTISRRICKHACLHDSQSSLIYPSFDGGECGEETHEVRFLRVHHMAAQC